MTVGQEIAVSEQILTSDTTGLDAFQLMKLQQTAGSALHAFENGQDQKAEQLCHQALQIFPNYAMPYAMLGMIARKYRNYRVSANLLKKSLEILPGVADRWAIYSLILKQLGEFEEALLAISKAVELNPNSVGALNNKASILNILGRNDEAKAIYLGLMKTAPSFGKPFHNFARLHKFKPEEEVNQLYDKLENEHVNITQNKSKMNAHFALGNYFEDLGQYEKGFLHFLNANKMLKSDREYNVENAIARFDKLTEKFQNQIEKTAAENTSGVGAEAIFVLGMPRSGTTLVEQILASHPLVNGAGELEMLGEICKGFENKFSILSEIPKSEIKAKAIEYLDFLKSFDANSQLLVDKMPHNFLNIGYINLLLPKAKIVHCRRNPIDTCLSIFRLQFEDKLHFSTDLADLGKYYVAYDAMMKKWHGIFPNKILDVHYEDVVQDLESQARRIVEFIGIDWNDACLEFHKHKRAVHTASTNQVRQPIYKSSIGRYERYGDLLNPLLEALKPVL